MDDIYGDDGFGVVEAHHNDPLARDGERVTRVEDLSPVCPNCHAILHRSEMTVSQLRKNVKAMGMAY